MALEINNEIVLTPPRDAASVLLLRDGAGVLEIYMIERSGQSDVLGGAYVFPGGKVDPADHDQALQVLTRHADADARRRELHRALGEAALSEAAAAAMFAAACRETHEEAGVSLDMLELVPFSRWITPRTPSMMRKRFDTRFFIALLPEAQDAAHDDHEAVSGTWLRPHDALARYWAKEIALAPPQIMSLAHLARFDSVDEVIGDARRRQPPLIEPEPFEIDGCRVVAYPGDERHPVAARAMPGPTRLVWRGGRFEPDGGFEAFFR